MALKVITKSQLEKEGFLSENIAELCGPASIAMLLESTGHGLSMEEVVRKMKQCQAFLPGVGTVLARVPSCFSAKITYLRYVPTWLLRFLLWRGYVCVHSVQHKDRPGGHIVFIYGYRQGSLKIYDPNKDELEPDLVPLREWRHRSNRRAVFAREDS